MKTPFRGYIGHRVRGAGPLDAKVVLLAEAPGETEEEMGAPLVGRSGSFLFDGGGSDGFRDVDPFVWPGLTRLGLGRDVVRCENVLEMRPPNNDLDAVSLESMARARADTFARLAQLPRMQLLVPMGNCALNAVLQTPLKQRKRRGGGGAEWKWPHSISAWRGSVNMMKVGEQLVTVIPTFHPALFLWRDGANFQAWRADWARVKEFAELGVKLDPLFDEQIVAPSWGQIERFQEQVETRWKIDGDNALLAFDIETIGPIIDCAGFCVDGKTTLTLPLLAKLWPGKGRDVRRAWDVFRWFMEHPIPKGTWWGYYDVFRVERQRGWKVRKWWWDGYNLHHLLDPMDEHKLSYVASRELAVPYWKHESKLDKARKRVTGDWRERHLYCGKDVGYTWHLIRRGARRLREGWEPPWQMMA